MTEVPPHTHTVTTDIILTYSYVVIVTIPHYTSTITRPTPACFLFLLFFYLLPINVGTIPISPFCGTGFSEKGATPFSHAE
jgi:hypothetical protein